MFTDIKNSGMILRIIPNKNFISCFFLNFTLRYYNSEDVSVGIWLAPVNNVLRIHDTRFDTEWTSRGCQNHYLISHNLSVNQIKQMYENIINKGNLCEAETTKRHHWLYNWTVPPSKCCK